MPTQGQILTNPISGDQFEFLETAASSNGERVVIKTTLKTKGILVPKHLHVLQDETFEVLAGQLTYIAENKLQQALPGTKFTLPKNLPHNHYNDADEPVVYLHTVTPALDFDYFIENLVGLAADGKFKDGKAGMIQELVSLKYLDSKAYLADIPISVQKALMLLVAPIGRMFGYRALYKKYTGVEK